MRRLAKSSWEVATKILRGVTLALVHFTAKYSDSARCCSNHTSRLIDKSINKALRTAVGCLRVTSTNILPLQQLGWHKPVYLRRKKNEKALARWAKELNHLLRDDSILAHRIAKILSILSQEEHLCLLRLRFFKISQSKAQLSSMA